jgi:hypothetical protein
MSSVKKLSKDLKAALEQFREIASELGVEVAYGENESG